MKTKRLTAAAILACILASTIQSRAQTFVSGNISGTWSPAGNPYIVSDNATVADGQTLNIQPGTVVWIGAGVSISTGNNSSIKAVGTPGQRITVQSPNSSQYWSQIYLNNSSGVTNQFTCCDFSGATNAILIGANTAAMVAKIMDCTFSNCVSSAIAASAGMFFTTNRLFISANIFSDLSGPAFLLFNSGNDGSGTASIINSTFVNCAGGVNVTDP
jgi:hypothetical protein